MSQCQIKDPVSHTTSSVVDGYDTVPSASITIDLINKGVESWSFSCISTDDQLDYATVNSTYLVVDDLNKTAVLTVDSNSRGATYIFKSVVGTSTFKFAICSLGTVGYRLLAKNQTNESNLEFGWIEELNNIILDIPTEDTLSAYPNPADYMVTTGNISTDILDSDITKDGYFIMSGGPLYHHGIGNVAITTTYSPSAAIVLAISTFIFTGVGASRRFILPTATGTTGKVAAISIVNASANSLDIEDSGGVLRTLTTFTSANAHLVGSDWIVDTV